MISILQEFHTAVLDVIHRTDDPQAGFLFHVVDAQALLDLLHTVPHVPAAGLIGVFFIANGFFDLIGDALEIPLRLVVEMELKAEN